MTYEHAVSATEAFHIRSIENFCVPASLDASLARINIDFADYMPFVSAAYKQLKEEQLEDQQPLYETIADKYFPGAQVAEGWKTGNWVVADSYEPYDRNNWQDFGTPKPEHFAYQELLDGIDAEFAAGVISEASHKTLVKMYKASIGMMVAIDNAFDAGLVVLGNTQARSGEDHVFGITREGAAAYYVYNTGRPLSKEDTQRPIEKIGPITLKQLLGIRDPDCPADWPAIEQRKYDLFEYVIYDDEQCYSIRLFPPEPGA